MANTLIPQATADLPKFNDVIVDDIEPALDQILNTNRAILNTVTESNDAPSWQNVFAPIEDMDTQLGNMWAVVSHLNNVMNTDPIRDAYNKCLPKLIDYSTEVSQNTKLFEKVKALKESNEFEKLDTAQQTIVNHSLRDFKLSGIALPEEKKQRYKAIQEQLAKLSTKFEENVLDATDGWHHLIINGSELAGIPQHAIDQARMHAKKRNKQGWIFKLDFPSYYAVITYAQNREFRQIIYTAYVTRASSMGPNAGQWDNTQIIEELLTLKQELAKLLGFENYAELSLATKMAENCQQVMDFLNQLASHSHQVAQSEWQELQAYAAKKGLEDELKAWDVSYYSELLKQEKYSISQEALRPYFPEEKVLSGLFTIIHQLYGINIQNNTQAVETWHNDVLYFDVLNANQQKIAGFYLDLYARPHKRGGAWMDDCRSRHQFSNGTLQLPIAYINCNFSEPSPEKASCLTHEEVLTIFHEVGHGLHHMLTQVNYQSVSGINDVAWDAVELPSQFMENFCWQKQGLELISSHIETGEPLPDDILEKLIAAKNFHTGMYMVRQLEFSIFDFRLHMEYQSNKDPLQVQNLLDEVRSRVSVVPVPRFNAFQNSFSHIFGGGYSAGYYSYKWAEVLSCDVFTEFEEAGVLSSDVGQRFLTTLLSKGGSVEAMDLFKAFMGREPQIEALLKHSGLL